jgi:hypothetical protein
MPRGTVRQAGENPSGMCEFSIPRAMASSKPQISANDEYQIESKLVPYFVSLFHMADG